MLPQFRTSSVLRYLYSTAVPTSKIPLPTHTSRVVVLTSTIRPRNTAVSSPDIHSSTLIPSQEVINSSSLARIAAFTSRLSRTTLPKQASTAANPQFPVQSLHNTSILIESPNPNRSLLRTSSPRGKISTSSLAPVFNTSTFPPSHSISTSATLPSPTTPVLNIASVTAQSSIGSTNSLLSNGFLSSSSLAPNYSTSITGLPTKSSVASVLHQVSSSTMNPVPVNRSLPGRNSQQDTPTLSTYNVSPAQRQSPVTQDAHILSTIAPQTSNNADRLQSNTLIQPADLGQSSNPPAATLSSSLSACGVKWAQCGGASFNGSPCCASGFVCIYQSYWYWQCQ